MVLQKYSFKIEHSAILLFFVLLFFSNLSGQTNDSTYQKYLLNSENVPQRVYYSGDSKNILKTDLTSILDGNLPFIWEHRFSDYFGLDCGLGLILPYTFADIINSKSSDDIVLVSFGMNPSYRNYKFGESFQIEPKIFLGITSSSYLGVFYGYRNYYTMKIHEAGISYGYNFDFNKITYQTSFALSYVSQQSKASYNDVRYYSVLADEDFMNGSPVLNGIRLSVRLQLGYIFENRLKPIKSTK
ncbi:MAG: hypothetical protein PHR83_03725 [Paludibacter sp.]|nr:hypothetical protein [Paludibacter sp.]